MYTQCKDCRQRSYTRLTGSKDIIKVLTVYVEAKYVKSTAIEP